MTVELVKLQSEERQVEGIKRRQQVVGSCWCNRPKLSFLLQVQESVYGTQACKVIGWRIDKGRQGVG